MPRFSLSWALLVSLVVHAMLFVASDVRALLQPLPVPAAKFPMRLEARLRDEPSSQERAHEPLLKNTLSDDETNVQQHIQKKIEKTHIPVSAPDAIEKSAKPAMTAKPVMARTVRPVEEHPVDAVQKAQRKLSRHMYYPAEAIDQGLEGEVRLLLRLSEDGRVLSVSVAASSGFPILDQAALAAARAMGKIPDVGMKELLLPVVFRLQ